ncbi:MAG: hypothetical protein RIT45_1121 [Pseudomonadota bacterium]|jgi:starvation-inducible outer membrane lipoprotein
MTARSLLGGVGLLVALTASACVSLPDEIEDATCSRSGWSAGRRSEAMRAGRETARLPGDRLAVAEKAQTCRPG